LNQIQNQEYGIKISDEQKQEVLLSYEESKNEENLIDNEEVMKKYRRWLEK
jgi:hypothetical protein